jgi:hypothetical protein
LQGEGDEAPEAIAEEFDEVARGGSGEESGDEDDEESEKREDEGVRESPLAPVREGRADAGEGAERFRGGRCCVVAVDVGHEYPARRERCMENLLGTPARMMNAAAGASASVLFGRLLLVKIGAHGHRGVGIDGAIAFLDVLDDPFLVDDDVGALRPLIRLVLDVVALQDAVRFEHLLVHVAEERKLDVDLLGEGSVGSGTIEAYAEDFRVGGIDLACGESSLDRLKLLRSTLSEGKNVNGEKDVLLAAIVAELDVFPLVTEEGEVGSDITDLKRDLSECGLLGLRRSRSQSRRRG